MQYINTTGYGNKTEELLCRSSFALTGDIFGHPQMTAQRRREQYGCGGDILVTKRCQPRESAVNVLYITKDEMVLSQTTWRYKERQQQQQQILNSMLSRKIMTHVFCTSYDVHSLCVSYIL